MHIINIMGGKMKLIVFILFVSFLFFGCAPKVIQPGVYEERIKEERGTITPEKAESKTETKKDSEIIREAKIEEEDILKRESKKEKKSEDVHFSDVLFDFDSYIIKSEYYPLLDSLSGWLKSVDKVIIIEGHCDERGTQEYNLVLGQKRAEAVREYLLRKGVDPKKLKVISYGKEKPLDPRHTEEAWAKNRRAHFKVEQ